MDSLEIGVGGASFCLHLQAVVTGGLCSFVRAMATYVERKEQVATWDGNQSHWLDYVKRVRLQYERTPFKKRQYLGAELVTRLTGKAWDVASADIDHDRLQASDGPAYLLQFLEQRLCKAPVPDSGQRLEDFFIRLRRVPGASMTEWATQVRETYRRLQRALARQRFEGRPPTMEKKKEESVAGSVRPTPSLLRTPESRQRRSDVTSPRAFAGEESERRMRDDEVAAERQELPREETVRSRAEQAETLPQEQDQEAERGSVHTGSQRSGWHEQWTAEEWADWHAWRTPSRKRWKDSSDDEAAEQATPIKWEQFDYGDIQVLPPEILGWILLRRSGLPASARLSVLSAINNRLDLDTMERAMRDQEEELLMAEAHRSHGALARPRRSFWVEQDKSWGLVADYDTDDIDEASIMWVGDHLPEEVYGQEETAFSNAPQWSTWTNDGQELQWEWYEDDFYAQDSTGCYWSWAETKDWMDVEECFTVSPSEAAPVMEAYNLFQDKLRTFKESRVVNNAKQLSRGYYPFSMFKGKGKGKQKSKGKSFGKKGSFSPSPSSSSAFALSGKGVTGQKPGSPEYKGCFICGSQEHDFRSCPKRQQPRSSGQSLLVTNATRSVFMVEPLEEVADDMVIVGLVGVSRPRYHRLWSN